ncbi:hypothetical protein [Brevundimonas sp.]
MTAQAGTQDPDYETAQSGTIYWTISLYIEPDKVASALGLTGRIGPDQFRRLQRGHLPSLALANAIDPLMNDIADRETQGEVQEFLLAATDETVADMHEASAAARKHQDLVFRMPRSVSWTTEGVRFCAHPQGLDRDRAVRLRRFWLSHNNGALSYHLSFSHYYGGDKPSGATGYPPSTYYFLSLLQKLAAPKEYALDATMLQTEAEGSKVFDVLSGQTLGIDPLDDIHVALKSTPTSDPAEGARFWPFIASTFQNDAAVLFGRLGQQLETPPALAGTDWLNLLERVPFIEVPGLKMPKSRFMFMLHDKAFFDRLMPLDADSGEAAPRKTMVRQGCYEPYQEKIRVLLKPMAGKPPRAVHLGRPKDGPGPNESADADYWSWVEGRSDYEDALSDGVFVRANPDFVEARGEDEENPRWLPISDGPNAETQMKDLVAAMRSGDCVQIRSHRGKDGTPGEALETPVVHHVPAFELRRADCLEYLFLAGFNQNIIDFMNQDTSEILDSIDPIYPDSSDQSSDRFFVRYANHRAMITYVPRSRSLETGNDYIGACPYAFLIHSLALHNEFLARSHEAKTLTRIERIEALIEGRPLPDTIVMTDLERQEPLEKSDTIPTDEARQADFVKREPYRQAEAAINQAKLAEFSQYERFRHANPFRYETERDVFKTLEQLRGISRKQAALALAIKSLEDHASDLSRRQQQQEDEKRRDEDEKKKDGEKIAAANQKKIDEEAAKRGTWLNILLGMTGFFGAGQMFYWIGEKVAEGKRLAPSHMGETILSATEFMMTLALLAFLAMLGKVIWSPMRRSIQSDASKESGADK